MVHLFSAENNKQNIKNQCDAVGARPTAVRFVSVSALLLLLLAAVNAHVAAGGADVDAHRQLYLGVATCLSLLAKTATSGTFAASLLLTSQSYPPSLRSAGLGLGTSLGKVGATLAPPLAALVEPATALSATSVCLLVAALAAAGLPPDSSLILRWDLPPFLLSGRSGTKNFRIPLRSVSRSRSRSSRSRSCHSRNRSRSRPSAGRPLQIHR